MTPEESALVLKMCKESFDEGGKATRESIQAALTTVLTFAPNMTGKEVLDLIKLFNENDKNGN